MAAYLKDLNDPDPATREAALRTLPMFGPSVRKPSAKPIPYRMEKEPDPNVKFAAYAAAVLIGFDSDADIKEAVRILGLAAEGGRSAIGGQTRLYAVQALAAFGPKAEGAVGF